MDPGLSKGFRGRLEETGGRVSCEAALSPLSSDLRLGLELGHEREDERVFIEGEKRLVSFFSSRYRRKFLY